MRKACPASVLSIEHLGAHKEVTLDPIQLFGRPKSIVRILCYCLGVAVFVLGIAIPFQISGRSPIPLSFKITPKSMLENGWKNKWKKTSPREHSNSAGKKKKRLDFACCWGEHSISSKGLTLHSEGVSLESKCSCSVHALMSFNARFPVKSSTVLKGPICQR